MEKVKYETVIYKANMPLADGESLSQYTSALRDAVQKQAQKKLANKNGMCSAYMIETYADAVIVDVYVPSDPGSSMGSSYKFYAAPYTRAKDGTFNVGAFKEVKRVQSYQPADAIPIATNTTGVSTADASSITTTKSKESIPTGWEPVEKSLWNGVL